MLWDSVEGLLLCADAAQLSPGARPILLGRVDYRVRAIHQDTGDELFNVSYSQLSILDSSLKLPAFGETPALDEAEQASNLGISLDPDSKNSIHRVDPQSGNKMWSTGFEQPPITIFAGGEVGNSLYGETVWPTPDGLASRYFTHPSTVIRLTIPLGSRLSSQQRILIL